MAATPGTFSLSLRALVRDAAGRYLLLRRRSTPKKKTGLWELPGGSAKAGGSLDRALAREVRRVTGLEISVDAALGSGGSEAVDGSPVRLFMECHCASGQVRLTARHGAFKWVTLEGLLSARVGPDDRQFLDDYCHSRGYSRPQKHAAKRQPPTNTPWLEQQVRLFKQKLPLYEELAKVLREELEKAVHPICPLAEVHARTKSIPSFAEKILRKNKYLHPLKEVTDLCGLRVVTQTKSEADAVCQFITRNFEIDRKNSLDTRSRLGAREFGYRSVHYVVQLKRGRLGKFRDALYPLKAEIQVRTLLQHAWSDIGHDRLYKGGFTTPEVWEREASRLAAMLESADDGFARLVQGLEAYRSDFGAYLKPEQIDREIEIVGAVLRHDPRSVSLTHRLARLAMSRDDWDLAIRVIRDYKRRNPQPLPAGLLCCLGASLCQRHKGSPASGRFREGRDRLRDAVKLDPRNVEARLCLARTASSAAEKLKWFAAAFEADPTDPAALDGYVRHKVLAENSTAFIPLLRPSLEAAIERCRLQVSVGVNMPWALYRMAGFQLLLGPDHERECLSTLAQAVKKTTAASLIESALESTAALARVEPERRDVRCVQRMLLVALQARFSKKRPDPRLARLATGAVQPIPKPVVIVAGGCDPAHQSEMASYRDLLRRAFADFTGTLLSGGTRQGISGLVGEIGQRSEGRLRTLGYLPAPLPTDGSAVEDERYTEIRHTDGQRTFSALEPLQNWIDLLISGVRPEDVRVIGINGGDIAGFEYRLAWSLGAQVAVVRESGREADDLERRILADEFEGMLVVPRDALTLRAFLHAGAPEPRPLTEEQYEQMARLAHAKYLAENRHMNSDRTMRPWDDLDEDLQESNLDQVAYMTQILGAVGFDVVPAAGAPGGRKFTRGEIETMARMEHGRWNIERLRGGWRFDQERNPDKRLSPHLIEWEQLPEGIRDWDRIAVKRYPQLLGELGLAIVPRGSRRRAATGPRLQRPGSAPRRAAPRGKPRGRS
jgi:ppGpp synthetase/RelA/SpoT-type nucleotidyltranferase